MTRAFVWTKEQYEAHQRRMRRMSADSPTPPSTTEGEGRSKPSPRRKEKKPNKTELAYRFRFLSPLEKEGATVRYEGMTLRLQSGHRYTPDFIVVQNGRIECHEVKGSYRLQSYQRARLAFDEARAQWPTLQFVWAEKDKGGCWHVE